MINSCTLWKLCLNYKTSVIVFKELVGLKTTQYLFVRHNHEECLLPFSLLKIKACTSSTPSISSMSPCIIHRQMPLCLLTINTFANTVVVFIQGCHRAYSDEMNPTMCHIVLLPHLLYIDHTSNSRERVRWRISSVCTVQRWQLFNWQAVSWSVEKKRKRRREKREGKLHHRSTKAGLVQWLHSMKQASSKGNSVVECVFFSLQKETQKPSFQREEAFEQHWRGVEMEREANG